MEAMRHIFVRPHGEADAAGAGAAGRTGRACGSRARVARRQRRSPAGRRGHPLLPRVEHYEVGAEDRAPVSLRSRRRRRTTDLLSPARRDRRPSWPGQNRTACSTGESATAPATDMSPRSGRFGHGCARRRNYVAPLLPPYSTTRNVPVFRENCSLTLPGSVAILDWRAVSYRPQTGA